MNLLEKSRKKVYKLSKEYDKALLQYRKTRSKKDSKKKLKASFKLSAERARFRALRRKKILKGKGVF